MKTKDIIALSDQELVDKIKEGKAALNKMKINHNISPIENPITIRNARKNIARLLTETTKRKSSK